MKLEFDSVEDLGHFLHWAVTELAPRMSFKPNDSAVHVMTYATGAPATPTSLSSMVVGAAGTGASGSAGVAFDTPPGTTETKTYTDGTTATGPGPLPDQSPAQQDTELATTKRKRRTKAEIEAAAAAEAKPEEAAALAAAVVTDAGEASLEAARATLRDKVTPTGANPFETAAGASVTEDDPAATSGAEGAEKSAEPDIVTPFQHLTRGRDFIAKHGTTKYQLTFEKAGLGPNVMGYSAEQRALHVAAMDALEKA